METLESIIHIASHSSFSVFFWNIVCKLIPALIVPEVIRTWLLMEMNRCILPKSAVKSLCGIFMDDDEVMASLRHMASLYEMPPVTNEKTQDKIQSFLDALVVSKSPLKRDEITSQPNVSTKKPRVKAFIENMPPVFTSEREELARFVVSLTDYFPAGKSGSFFRRLNPLTFLRLWKSDSNTFYQNRQLFA